jgi:hypothetical protein
LVAAKIVCEIGVIPEFEGIARTLAEDPIRNVRSCLADGLRGTEWGATLCSDVDRT